MQKPAYESLKFYQDLCEVRRLINHFCLRFEKTRPRLASQMRDAARSAKQNIREGYRRGSLREFMQSIRISQGSLEELIGDIDDCQEDGLITEIEFNQISKLTRSAAYMMGRYLQSLYRMEKEGTWKFPGKNLSNVPKPHVSSRNIT